MEKIDQKWEYFIKDIEKKYCNQVSDIIYDKWNMNGKDYELEEVFTWIKNILEKICVDQKNYINASYIPVSNKSISDSNINYSNFLFVLKAFHVSLPRQFSHD